VYKRTAAKWQRLHLYETENESAISDDIINAINIYIHSYICVHTHYNDTITSETGDKSGLTDFIPFSH